MMKHEEPITKMHNKRAITDFTVNNATDSFNIKEKTTGQTGDNDTKNVETIVLLKYLSNFLRNLEMPSINLKINFDLNWSENCVIVDADAAVPATTF